MIVFPPLCFVFHIHATTIAESARQPEVLPIKRQPPISTVPILLDHFAFWPIVINRHIRPHFAHFAIPTFSVADRGQCASRITPHLNVSPLFEYFLASFGGRGITCFSVCLLCSRVPIGVEGITDLAIVNKSHSTKPFQNGVLQLDKPLS